MIGNTSMNRYDLYLNDSYYGSGDLKYMHELITDYISRMESFGAEEVEFKIEKWRGMNETNK